MDVFYYNTAMEKGQPSRRELFQKIIPSKHPQKEDGAKDNNNPVIAGISRRKFIEYTGATVANLAASQLKVPSAHANEITSPSTDETKEKQSYALTATEGALMGAANVVITLGSEKLNLPSNRSKEDVTKNEFYQKIVDMPTGKFIATISTMAIADTIPPLVEEPLFRWLPNYAFTRTDKGNAWEVGVPSTAIFALLHNYRKDKETGKYDWEKSIPLHQFAGGLLYWKLMRENGLSHSIVAHAMANITAGTLCSLSARKYPKLWEKENKNTPA